MGFRRNLLYLVDSNPFVEKNCDGLRVCSLLVLECADEIVIDWENSLKLFRMVFVRASSSMLGLRTHSVCPPEGG